MKAIGYAQSLPITEPRALFDFEAPLPEPGPFDLRVRVLAVSVNPVDTKVRRRRAGTPEAPVILGWDAAGIVDAVGAAVTLFKPGDEVFYAGDLGRPGTNAQFHLVDERIVGHKPKSLGFAEAAALPLTALTAWEGLFDRLGIPPRGMGGTERQLLIVGAAGGVGSLATQFARALTDVTVIGTASRAESRAWVEALGAHAVIDHSRPLAEELTAAGLGAIDYTYSLTHTDVHWAEIVKAARPQGRIALIDDPASLDVMPLKQKSLSLHWEFMFTRSMFHTGDMIRQHEILDEVARLVDAGTVRTTLGAHFGVINAANLTRAHESIEGGRSIGKVVLEGWPD
ncbi:zinc-binding alcohol dehydrogenase family protein [Angulomicrobium tetraedrale]|uniref:Zinc-type alcohol dehydrogenase-like protein n=1 Tax=Ancylobacter tetraedralis TaxID=217068 RepID=A0A839YZZ5_9HYPH|nr:zinc-binding alcohol dehydrogenase family protein [Ancylobacter tetraedralis]MBB3770084.1 zinc-binding alcohol dehydrogenase family protein [Ancylobacter tetraedralis]